MRWWRGAVALAALALLVAGCAPSYVWPDQPAPAGGEVAWVSSAESIGQTVRSREAGLSGAEVYLEPDQAGATDGVITLLLRDGPQSTANLASATLPLTSVTHPDFYHFSFTPQPDSLHRDYYLLLEVSGSGRVRAGSGPPDAYADGALYRNGTPAEGQLAFRLAYAPALVWRGVLADARAWLRWLGLAGLLLVLPGWVLLQWLWPRRVELGWAERLGLAAGLSAAIYPLLFLWTDVVGLHVGALYAGLPVLGALFALVAWTRPRRAAPAQPAVVTASAGPWWPPASWRRPCWRGEVAFALAFGGTVAAVALTRFWAARSVVAPMWGDSYQHALIAQLIVEQRGLFDSWQPYAPLVTFTYHFGFHTLVAVFHWLSALPLPQATLWMGQMLNVLAVVAVYPLGAWAGRSRWAGVGAMVVAGLLSPTPMVYTNWGRYTQLAGQVILPAAVVIVWALLDARAWDWRGLALGALALAGLALSHYRVLIFAVLFIGAYLLVNWRDWRRLLPLVAVLGVAGGVLFLPWFLHVFAGKILLIFKTQITTLPAAGNPSAEVNSVGDPRLYPLWLWPLAVVALGSALWRQERRLALVALWWFLIVLAANPQWLGLPGEGVLSNFTVFIAAYIPLGVLLGSAVAWAGEGRLPRAWAAWGRVALAVVVVALGLWGARRRPADIDPGRYGLVTHADLRAASWIRANLPAKAHFLVNSFFAFNDNVAVGSDGGWWLPALTNRTTTLPPINYSFEQGVAPDYAYQVNALGRALRQLGPTDPAVVSLLKARGVTHVYIGQKQGRVNYAGPSVLPPAELLASPFYRPVYRQDRVWIFELVQ